MISNPFGGVGCGFAVGATPNNFELGRKGKYGNFHSYLCNKLAVLVMLFS